MAGFGRAKVFLFFCVVCLLVFAVPFGTGARQVVDRVVAVVNDDVIRLREMEKALEPVKQQLESRGLYGEEFDEQLYKAREQILDELINQKLADQQVEEAGISVSGSDVENAIERIKQRNNYTDEDLRMALQMQAMTIEEYRAEIRKQILRSRLVNRKIKASIVVTDEEIRRYYEANPEEFGGEVRYELRNILLKHPQPEEEAAKDEIFDRMEFITAQLKEGESFERLAKESSEAPNASDGGELGRFGLEDLAPSIKSAIKDMEEGEFSGVVETEQGFQIFYVQDINSTPPKPLEEVSDKIADKLYEQRVNQKYNDWLESLREESYIRIIR
ncbi:MAG: SurA N-terminal domain-containing protein [Desulfobacteraceae bacterium]|nr:SurA N-terminal domain-containing protein [Desulfobacteraceae bacterium]